MREKTKKKQQSNDLIVVTLLTKVINIGIDIDTYINHFCEAFDIKCLTCDNTANYIANLNGSV